MLSMKFGFNSVCLGTMLLAVTVLQAKTLTVAKSGGQYATVQAGLNAATAGDTVLVTPGIYNEGVSFGKSGTAAGPITLLGQKGAILDGTGVGAEELVSIDSKSHVRVMGFEIRNLKKSGVPIGISISGGGSHIEIRGNHVHHIENANGNAHGIAAYGNSSTPISNLVVDGNEISDCKLGQSESMVLNGNVTDFVVSNNVVHDNDNIGIDFIGFEGTGPSGQDQARNGLCFGNRVYNISSATNPTYGGERSADGIYVDGGRDIVIERNTVDKCDIAFEIASEHGGKATSNITIRNNFASRSYQGNIMSGGYAANKGIAENIVIVGNTTYGGGDGEVVLQHNCKGVTIKNNIFFALSGQNYLVNSGSKNTAVVADNNLYHGASGTSPGDWADANAIYANPKLNNAPANLHLTAGSPAIDAGAALEAVVAGALDIDGEGRKGGSKSDVGADEFGSTTRLLPRLSAQRRLGGAQWNGLGRSLSDAGSDHTGLSSPRIYRK
ncbi:MAG: right-handed parallel beta-helix repeat-containing protein [Fibrobacterota bacterium]|nr:right-handed parallel beta-helix repeat-containing protein [Fibrobacterota bacterium]